MDSSSKNSTVKERARSGKSKERGAKSCSPSMEQAAFGSIIAGQREGERWRGGGISCWRSRTPAEKWQRCGWVIMDACVGKDGSLEVVVVVPCREEDQKRENIESDREVREERVSWLIGYAANPHQ